MLTALLLCDDFYTLCGDFYTLIEEQKLTQEWRTPQTKDRYEAIVKPTICC